MMASLIRDEEGSMTKGWSARGDRVRSIGLGMRRAMAASLAVAACASANGFELSPLPTQAERAAAARYQVFFRRVQEDLVIDGIHYFSKPVHEALTSLAWENGDSVDDYVDPDADGPGTYILAGVRWNDDPPFEFKPGQGQYTECQQARANKHSTVSFALSMPCWLQHFNDVKARASRHPGEYADGRGTLLARSHFGDLQFLHSMAGASGVDPHETQANILAWAEFTWKVMRHDIVSNTPMGKVPVPGIDRFFPANEERSVELLFTLGRPWVRHNLPDIAFGSLLHMVEDSFAGGHVERSTAAQDASCPVPAIIEFHTYPGQDAKAHSQADTLDAARARAQAKDSGLLFALKELIDRHDNPAPWDTVKPFLRDCIFKLSSDAKVSDTSVTP
jgi:hypothetical protein